MEGQCPLCDRELGDAVNRHHLVPKQKGGRETEWMHTICHNKIHSIFSNSQLENYYNTAERLLEHEEIRKFVAWVRKKPIDFYTSTREHESKRSRRR